jgi:conjugal transfer pilus assembly protein TraW
MRSRIKAVLAVILLILMVLPLQGNSTTDRLGPVYPIIEHDWLEWLPKQAEKRLKERPLALSEKHLKEAIQRQMPQMDLPEVKAPRTYYVDPAVKVSQPVADHTGKIIIPTGGRINPLDHLPGFRPIVVMDGRQERQVEWVKGVIAEVKPLVLLTGGDVLKLNTDLGISVYPAPEALIQKFSIERVPVLLSQESKQIKVQEIVP